MSATVEENTALETEFKDLTTLDVIRAMHRIQREKEALEAELKAVNKRFDYLRITMIPERFDSEGIQRLVVEGVGRVSITGDMYVSVKSETKHLFYDWLRDNGHGDLIQSTVNASSLKAMIKELVRKSEELPNDYLNVTPFDRASITKA